MKSCPVLPRLTMDTLQRIVVVGEQLQTDDVVLTVHSLELHENGFALNARLDWVGRLGGMPRLDWRVIDSAGGQHFCCGCGGSGGGPWFGTDVGPDDTVQHSWRMHCPFSYAIANDADSLRLDITAFRTSRPLFADDGSHTIESWERLREVTDLGGLEVAL